MNKIANADAYLSRHPEWATELSILRNLFLDSELKETIKWGIPCYTWENKNVCGFAAFKDWVAIWFYQGHFLSDPYQVLINAQEGKTQALRQWRFHEGDAIPQQQIQEYIIEATENQKQGLELKPKRKHVDFSDLPELMRAELTQDSELMEHWNSLSYSARYEYYEYIDQAKQTATKEKRMQKIIPLIQLRKGLHDKYKK